MAQETGLQVKIETFDSIKERFIKLTSEETFLKEASFALQHIQKNPYLAKVDRQSLIVSVLNISQVGLTLNPILKFAYLVPRKGQCVLEISYAGLVKVATDTGSVKNIYAHCIYGNDVFEQKLGTSPEIIHQPKLGNRGSMIGVYAVAVLHDGSKQVEVIDIDEINGIRDTSESWKAYIAKKIDTCIWNDYPDEMARKTVIKRICKYLPKTDRWEQLAKAIEIDNRDYEISYAQAGLIESLLLSATIPEERKQWIEKTMNLLSADDATKLIAELKEKQVDRINAGLGYNQTEIKEKLKEVK